MNHTYKVLKSDIKQFAAALSQVKVYVVQSLGEGLISIIDYGGTIEKFSPYSVKIAGAYYMRNQFELRVDMKEPTGL
ncbi:hypothetical protein L8C07_09490 [Paenibacillus sp. CMAA1739]|uniref:hypothetical protein n=1 Tax=Paenibacillus ottowii TaxID=2315729 RepID=UPI00272F8BB8|nr:MULTISPECIES: hypothetical protein [Paenibacillus]MDP1511326.1 hypothetical protein [Paenibacillus ottowii]MEC4566177.1 hypothetical protein [Paenibacillus sp. CMAA1739]